MNTDDVCRAVCEAHHGPRPEGSYGRGWSDGREAALREICDRLGLIYDAVLEEGLE